MKGHKDRVKCVLWSLDGSQLFSASNDLTIRCWDPERAECIGEPWTGHSHYMYSLSLSPDGTKLVSASIDQTVRFWDAHSGANPIEHSLQHEDHVYTVAFSPCGEFVASGECNGKLLIWRVPWWDESKKLQLPAVLVPKDQDQGELDSLDMSIIHLYSRPCAHSNLRPQLSTSPPPIASPSSRAPVQAASATTPSIGTAHFQSFPNTA
ncbi:hypothetical protein PAXRUDRAFT_666586 [Paxillus rubicundulus Ve08.2h10]|uniref:WD40 repeat-like protein n=1 Tax=Paxillus rubicundulus Ve08.2h10 TaxID=930991 RepID=A0A0D0E1X3_9AGAM|nr:hypothetical protein PAXRUDRAFT_666586 [Paxillus rubicundulus Ve08.2h10]